jgi:hypothetical protein
MCFLQDKLFYLETYSESPFFEPINQQITKQHKISNKVQNGFKNLVI